MIFAHGEIEFKIVVFESKEMQQVSRPGTNDLFRYSRYLSWQKFFFFSSQHNLDCNLKLVYA